MRWLIVLSLVIWAANQQAGRAQVNEMDPYYPNRKFPKLITPQWVGEDGVEAVVILAIDDMKDPKRYEAFLRPILRRLQKIDGRAPVSIMTCSVNPADPQLQTWLKEGLSIECHTFDHPCPFFKGGFTKAKGTYDKCVDLLHAIPNTKPVAFRMPCCDSLNTPSPRFWAEIFNKTTAKGNYLTIDSSVFNVFTSDDPELPKDLVRDAKGGERFKKYLPLDRSFVNTTENYPYPYVIGKLCWEFPCMTPSDWQAQHLQKPCNPQTVEDWKAALDCTVIKQGVFAFVFHPHGWIKNDQMVEFIDYAVAKHGKKVKFLTFKEAQERLNTNLFNGPSLRTLRTTPNVVVRFPPDEASSTLGVEIVTRSRTAMTTMRGAWTTGSPRKWQNQTTREVGDYYYIKPDGADDSSVNSSFRLIPHPDLKSGVMLVIRLFKRTLITWTELGKDEAVLAPFSLPSGAELPGLSRKDRGLRFIDLDGDGHLDVIFSNEKEYGIYLFKDLKEGWSRKVMAGKAGDKDALPMISRNGTNNGFWVHSGSLWWSNEDTVLLKDHVDRRSIKELLKRAN